jgi:hypothetical protein
MIQRLQVLQLYLPLLGLPRFISDAISIKDIRYLLDRT